MRIEKSTGVSFLLAFLFGPLGLLYVSKLWGFLLSIGYILIAMNGGSPSFFDFVLWWVCIWVLCLILSVMLASRNNKKVAEAKHIADEARHQETLAALGGRSNA